MGSIFGGILCPVLGILLGIAASVLLLRRSRRQRCAERKKREEIERRCARCGYDLRGLELPRCPECGTLWGFRVPLDELGLSEIHAKRRAGSLPLELLILRASETELTDSVDDPLLLALLQLGVER